MPVAGAFAGRLSRVRYGTDGVTYNDVEKIRSPKVSGSNDVAETSNNDDNGHKTRVYTWQDMSLSFEMVADENATVQEQLWTAFLNRTIGYFDLHPRGTTSGNKTYKMQGLVTAIDVASDTNGIVVYSVTVQKTGAPTRANQ